MSASDKSTQSYRPDIDGLRAVAVAAVVAHHIWPDQIKGGFVGVDVFFVISGYLITGILAREIGSNSFSFKQFYARRARRILPALFAMLFAVMVSGYFLMLPTDYLALLKAGIGAIFSASNVLFWSTTDYFAPDAKMNPLLHTWSLGVEEQFYLLFPILLILMASIKAAKPLLVLGVCGLASLIAASVLVEGHTPAVFFLSPFRAWELLAGAGLAVSGWKSPSRAIGLLCSVAGLTAILYSVFAYQPDMLFPGISAALPVLGSVLLIYARPGEDTVVSKLLTNRPAIFVGLISYSLYLWHWPIIVFTKYVLGAELYSTLKPAVLLASMVAGVASYYCIERPLRYAAVKPVMWFAPTIAIVVLAAFAGVGVSFNGFERRVDSVAAKWDRGRRDPVPYRACDTENKICLLGATGIAPQALFWGDSHMLAWAPAIHSILSRESRSAYFIARSSCPPISQVDRASRPNCKSDNLRTLEFLRNHPEISVVVVGAYWDFYKRPGQLIQPAKTGSPALSGQEIASLLEGTLNQISHIGRSIVILGNVPSYEDDVPQRMAIERSFDVPRARSIFLPEVKVGNDWLRGVANSRKDSIFVDPAEWLCEPQCIRSVGDMLLYRDSNHLSVAGAAYLQLRLQDSLRAGSPVRHVSTGARDIE